jgi:hypothetical protein
MKHPSWESNRLETMRARFEKCGIAVNDARPEHSGGGIEILPDRSPLECRVHVYGPGIVRYILRLRLLSDDANRVISGFMIEIDTDAVRVLEVNERVPLQYLSWDPDTEHILNDHIGQPFGPTLVREGLLLGESLKSPVIDRRHRWASITVGVVDQFDNCYEEDFEVRVHDEIPDAEWAALTRRERRGAGLFEPDEDATPEERRKAAVFAETLGRDQRSSEPVQHEKKSTGKANGICRDRTAGGTRAKARALTDLRRQ